MSIKGFENNYKRRVYLIDVQEKEEMMVYTTFVNREAITGERIFRSVETDKHYMITEQN